ncbi:hypothetical protein CIN_20610 [Commensalibacter intestini A911]|uniref:Uncharacterized protein n=1 Tax=Commensalibacter intestini A911 TaxID=1088868 RepID=G6F365_9PROT|nr:hypothetical protein [Commensalibacter intestini]EHD13078.1 hypothetical protein CIN_20610 [Commensalibacter intestini A911]
MNTDDRHLFNGDVANLHLTFDENADHQSWENSAAAPLTVARDQVEPIWQRLDRRATQQGYALVSKPEVTRDPALCLITQKGERIQPIDVKGNTWLLCSCKCLCCCNAFKSSVTIRSRRSIP